MHSFQAGNIYEFTQVKNLSPNMESPNIQLVQTMDYPPIIHYAITLTLSVQTGFSCLVLRDFM